MIQSRGWCHPTPRSVTASKLRGGKTQIYTSLTACSHLALPLRSICKHLEMQLWVAEQKLCSRQLPAGPQEELGLLSTIRPLLELLWHPQDVQQLRGHSCSSAWPRGRCHQHKHIKCKHSTSTSSQSAWLSSWYHSPWFPERKSRQQTWMQKEQIPLGCPWKQLISASRGLGKECACGPSSTSQGIPLSVSIAEGFSPHP